MPGFLTLQCTEHVKAYPIVAQQERECFEMKSPHGGFRIGEFLGNFPLWFNERAERNRSLLSERPLLLIV